VADTLAIVLLKQEKTEQALKLLQAATEDSPGIPEIHYHYAIALARTGDRKAARTELQKALTGNRPFSKSDEARKLLAELQK
jgi:Flp pilus assembly protein TadD